MGPRRRFMKLLVWSRMSQKEAKCCRPSYWNNLHIHSQRYSQPLLFETVLWEINFLAALSCSISSPRLLSQQGLRSFAQQMCTEPFLDFSLRRYERVGRCCIWGGKMPQRAEPPKIWERNELKFLGIDLIVMLHLRSPDILIEEVQGAFFKLNI